MDCLKKPWWYILYLLDVKNIIVIAIAIRMREAMVDIPAPYNPNSGNPALPYIKT